MYSQWKTIHETSRVEFSIFKKRTTTLSLKQEMFRSFNGHLLL